jgi:hypothetical protein
VGDLGLLGDRKFLELGGVEDFGVFGLLLFYGNKDELESAWVMDA